MEDASFDRNFKLTLTPSPPPSTIPTSLEHGTLECKTKKLLFLTKSIKVMKVIQFESINK